MAVAFRRHTLLPLDAGLHALQPTIPELTRSSLHRCVRNGISRLPSTQGGGPGKKHFKAYPIGLVHIDTAEVRTEQGCEIQLVTEACSAHAKIVRWGREN